MAGTRFGSKKASTKKAGTRKYQCREGSNPPGRVSGQGKFRGGRRSNQAKAAEERENRNRKRYYFEKAEERQHVSTDVTLPSPFIHLSLISCNVFVFSNF